MRIGITMGDASGIGPELILRAYAAEQLQGDMVVIGDYEVLAYCDQLLALGVPLCRVGSPAAQKQGCLNVYDLGLLEISDLAIGQISEPSGAAAKRYVETATRMALEGTIDAIVTLPMNKEATRLSAPQFTGHTELIAALCGETNYTMMLASDKLIVTHVHTHVSMAEAVHHIVKERVYQVIHLTHQALTRFIDRPRIAVAGLNPHAGENGAFGREELEEIAPAVRAACQAGMDVCGPLPPDTVFIKAARKEFDAVVCMYHDQGHIPMKLLDFEGGVNITLGLKVIRTSVDHGTAFDIAYQGIASTQSLVSAYRFAQRLVGAKK